MDSHVSDQCNILSPALCRIVNADSYTLLVAMWATLQLTWVTMLLFVQFIQVSRAMTTYENMFGIDQHSATSLTSAFTSTGMPLGGAPPSGSAAQPEASSHGHGHSHGGHGHSHGKGGFLKQWGKLLGVDAFIETATGRGAATGSKSKRNKKKNPYSRGCVTNCRDFWCDPSPVFGRRENGSAVLGGDTINYTEMYESPTLMNITGGTARRSRRTGGYEAVAGEEEV
jgi:palmitoyltransferase